MLQEKKHKKDQIKTKYCISISRISNITTTWQIKKVFQIIQHTSTNRHHCLGVVGAVNMEATDVLIGGDNCIGFKLFTACAIWRHD